MELECVVSGKPKPIILWSRADKEAPMPDGSMQMETYDGILRIVNVSREMTGSYRCQTSQYNGFNVKPREAVVELIVQCEYKTPGVFCRNLNVGVNAFCHTTCSSLIVRFSIRCPICCFNLVSLCAVQLIFMGSHLLGPKLNFHTCLSIYTHPISFGRL